MGIPRMWKRRSLVMKIAPWIMAIGTLLHTFCLATDHWAFKLTANSTKIEAGLFSYLGDGHREYAPVGTRPVLYPTLAILSLIFRLVDFVVNLGCLHGHFALIMITMILLSLSAGVLLCTDLAFWAIPHLANGFHLAWSFGLAGVIVVMDFVAAALCVVEAVTRWREPQPRFEGHERPFTENDLDEIMQSECDTL